jgi:hypothetical protein
LPVHRSGSAIDATICFSPGERVKVHFRGAADLSNGTAGAVHPGELAVSRACDLVDEEVGAGGSAEVVVGRVERHFSRKGDGVAGKKSVKGRAPLTPALSRGERGKRGRHAMNPGQSFSGRRAEESQTSTPTPKAGKVDYT